MSDMPRPRPPYLYPQTSRHGRVTWYVRRRGKKTPLKAAYGSDDFNAEYRAALDGKPLPAKPGAPHAGTLAWGLDQYRQSAAWLKYSTATRRQRETIFRQVIKTGGNAPIGAVTRAKITEGVDKRAHTPNQARHFLNAMRGFFEWAVKAQHAQNDPTAGVEAPARKKGGGFKIWTMADLDAYEKRWPIGTRERVWMDTILYSGLRRGDAVRLGKQHRRIIKDRKGRPIKVHQIATEKGGETIIVTLPILPVFERTLDAGPCGDLAYICGVRRGPLKKESFGNDFHDACRAAGVAKSAHGLRKVAATRAAQNGASEAQLEALFGWVRGSRVARIYTEAAERERLAMGAAHMLGDEDAVVVNEA